MFRYNDYIQDDWATIAAHAENGTAPDVYPIGARKKIPVRLNGVDYNLDVEIIGYNHDNLADGSGKAGITFFCKELPDFIVELYEGNTNDYGWEESYARHYLNEELYKALPEDLKNVMKLVTKISDGGPSKRSLVETEDYCWLLSYNEVGFDSNNIHIVNGQGELYIDTFKYGNDGDASRIRYKSDGYTAGYWWLRTTYYGEITVLGYSVSNTGSSIGVGLWSKWNIPFGFCV